MAKSQATAPVPATMQQAAESQTPNTAAPRKKRVPGVKYTTVKEGTYVPAKDGEVRNPLDNLAASSKGGLKFPGLIFEQTMWGLIVKVPAKQTAIKNPTVRDIVRIVDELFKG